MSEWTGITGSAAFDVVACPPRAALSKCIEPSGKFAERGNELHNFAYCISFDPANREKYEEAVSEQYRHTARGMNLAAALEGIKVLGCEVAFALNVKDRTCRKIGSNIERKYNETLLANGEPPLSKYEVPFTVDVLGQSEALGCPLELDYKSGQSIGDVEQHGQRRISAAGLMFFYGADTAISRVAYIWDSGEIRPDGHEFSILDAWETCDALVIAIDAVEEVKEQLARGETPTVFPDEEKQCRYCSAYNACPYWTNLVNGALGKKFGEPTTPEERGKLYAELKQLEGVVEETLKRLKKEVYEGGVLPVDDKYEYAVLYKKGKTSFDADAARGLIKTLLVEKESETEIAARLAKLNRQGPDYPEVRKRKRSLPLAKSA